MRACVRIYIYIYIRKLSDERNGSIVNQIVKEKMSC